MISRIKIKSVSFFILNDISQTLIIYGFLLLLLNTCLKYKIILINLKEFSFNMKPIKMIKKILLILCCIIGLLSTTVVGLVGYKYYKNKKNDLKITHYQDAKHGLVSEVTGKLSDKQRERVLNKKIDLNNPEHKLLAVLQTELLKQKREELKQEALDPRDPNVTTLVTNTFSVNEPSQYLPAKTKIYDLTFIRYSQKFADIYNYPQEYVIPMTEGVHVIEFQLKTDGVFNDVFINLLLEQDLGLDLPEKDDYVMRYSRNLMRFRLPETPKGTIFPKEDQDNFRHWLGYENYYDRNIYLATKDHVFNKKGASKGTKLMEYSQTYYPSYQYLSIYLGYSIFVQDILKENNASIWIKKKGGRDYRHTAFMKAEECYILDIPHDLCELVLPIMEEMDTFFYSKKLQRS